MTHDHMAANLAVRLAEHHLHSARPDAPVVPERGPSPRARRARASLADGLHRLARWLEPTDRPIVVTHRPR